MSKTWFTSDTHFGHSNIIRYCNRPFQTAQEMDAKLIENWNDFVRPNDIVYHLGDFAFGKDVGGVYAKSVLDRLHGRKHLIIGNHEEAALGAAASFESVQPYLELKKSGKHYVLFHYPIRSWHRQMKGSRHLFGHCHGGVEPRGRSLDIGVDSWNFRPVSFEELEAHFEMCAIYSEEKGFVCRDCKKFPCECTNKETK